MKDYLPLVTHMHLKDYKGWQYYGGYCPWYGHGRYSRYFEDAESQGLEVGVMVELDPSKGWTNDPSRNGQNDQSLFGKDGLQVPHIVIRLSQRPICDCGLLRTPPPSSSLGQLLLPGLDFGAGCGVGWQVA